MAYILSIVAVFNFTCAGSKHRRWRIVGWGGGLLSQGLWAYYSIYIIQQKGLLIMTAMYAGTYGYNLYKAWKGLDR